MSNPNAPMDFSDQSVLDLLGALRPRYPEILRWYQTRILPRAHSSVRIALGCTDGVPCGIAIADLSKNKLCTLYVSETYRGNGLGTTLLQAALVFLNTTRPYFTCAEAVLPAYQGIIHRYGWVISPHERVPDQGVPGGPEKYFNVINRRITL